MSISQELAAFLTPTIAVLGVYIAYNQWRTNKDSLRERLYEKRFDVYKGTQKLLSKIIHRRVK
jgi:hypothetical protein